MKTSLSHSALDLVARATFKKTAEIGFRHAQENLPHMTRTILDLPKAEGSHGSSAIVMSAGPSLHRRESVQRVRDLNYRGTVVVADGALGACLRAGLVPDYVVTVDPHPTWIIRWFGDPDLARRADDDYFRRQDLDPALNTREHERNEELIALVNQHGPKIKVIIATCVSPNVTRRCLQVLWAARNPLSIVTRGPMTTFWPMRQPRPRREPSRTWETCQITVPAPISTSLSMNADS